MTQTMKRIRRPSCESVPKVTVWMILASVRDRLSSSHPVHIELVPPHGGRVVLDLSIYGTPEGVSDDDLVAG